MQSTNSKVWDTILGLTSLVTVKSYLFNVFFLMSDVYACMYQEHLKKPQQILLCLCAHLANKANS